MSVHINGTDIPDKCSRCRFSNALGQVLFGTSCPLWTVCYEKSVDNRDGFLQQEVTCE